MTQKELVDSIAAHAGLTKKDADKALKSVLGAVYETLRKGNKVVLPGFGTFQVAVRKKRSGINPQTQKKIIIPETKVPKFKAGKKLREIVKK
jgi:DNA-binding protein HU-beta